MRLLVFGVMVGDVCRSWPCYWSERRWRLVAAAATVPCDGTQESTAGS